MNQKGWGLSTLIGFLFLFGFFLVISAILYNKNFSHINKNIEEKNDNVQETSEKVEDIKTNNYDYTQLENTLQEGAEEYISYQNIKSHYQIIIPLEDLKSYLPEDLLDPMTGKECNGYIIYNKKNITPFIKCGSNYQTKKYNDSFEN